MISGEKIGVEVVDGLSSEILGNKFKIFQYKNNYKII